MSKRKAVERTKNKFNKLFPNYTHKQTICLNSTRNQVFRLKKKREEYNFKKNLVEKLLEEFNF